jgi:hypothetical protein
MLDRFEATIGQPSHPRHPAPRRRTRCRRSDDPLDVRRWQADCVDRLAHACRRRPAAGRRQVHVGAGRRHSGPGFADGPSFGWRACTFLQCTACAEVQAGTGLRRACHLSGLPPLLVARLLPHFGLLITISCLCSCPVPTRQSLLRNNSHLPQPGKLSPEALMSVDAIRWEAMIVSGYPSARSRN